MTTAGAFEQILFHHIRPIGKWQWRVLLLLVFPMAVPFVLFPTFANLVPLHRCRIPQLDGHLSFDDVTNLSIPFKDPDVPPQVGQSFQPCQRYGLAWLTNQNLLNMTFEELLAMKEQWYAKHMETENQTTEECKDGYAYDAKDFRNSIINEFDLVCDRQWLAPMTTTGYMLAQMVSSWTTGLFSDRFGRKLTIIIASFVQVFSGVVIAFSPNVIMYTCFRLIIAFCAGCVYVTGYILIIEITNSKYRNLFGMLCSFDFVLLATLLSGLAHLTQDWKWLHICLTGFCLPCLLYPWFLPESPRWLITVDRWDEATVEIRRAVQINNPGVIIDDAEYKRIIDENPVVKSENARKNCTEVRHSLYTLLKTAELRKRTIIMPMIWGMVGILYYGCSFYSVKMQGNIYVMAFAMVAVGFPANLLQYFLYEKFDRRRPLLAMFAVAAPLFAASFLGQIFASDIGLLINICATVAKLCIDCTFSMIYLFTPELFPTELRNFGIGLGNCIGRIGAAISPFIVQLGETTWRPLPMLIFTGAAASSLLLAFFLPDTKNVPLPDTADEFEHFEENNIQLQVTDMNE